MENFSHLTNDQKIALANSLEKERNEHLKTHYYHNNREQSLKLVLNQEYGAISNQHYLMFNNNVAGSITFCGRELIKKMDLYNQKYWYGQWHKDVNLHRKLHIKNVRQISEDVDVSIYCDTDSLFLSYNAAIEHSEWKNLIFNPEYINSVNNNFMIICKDNKKLKFDIKNPLFKGYINIDTIESADKLLEMLNDKKIYTLIIDGYYLKNKFITNIVENNKSIEVICNFSGELEFIHAIDYYRIANYFKQCLDKHAKLYGVDNVQDFELEKIADAIINIEKKRYIMNLVWEDGRYYDSLKNIQAKGFDIVRSSTPVFARGGKSKKDGIMKIIIYLFENPDNFEIKTLLKLVKDLRREMELLPIDDICAQSSCSDYENKVINDKDTVEVETGAHFIVKAAAYHNYLLHNNKEFESKYEAISSGEKVKYYYCKGSKLGLEVFAYRRGNHPIEIAPEVDYDESFFRFVLSPINSIVESLKLPIINRRLSIVMDLFSNI